MVLVIATLLLVIGCSTWMTIRVRPTPARRDGFDSLVVVAVLATATAILYVVLMISQEDSPFSWFLFSLLVVIVLLGVAASRAAPYRAIALVIAGFSLLTLGVLGILSIGLPLVPAGGLALVSASRD